MAWSGRFGLDLVLVTSVVVIGPAAGRCDPIAVYHDEQPGIAGGTCQERY
jgi:hypothetical protein